MDCVECLCCGIVDPHHVVLYFYKKSFIYTASAIVPLLLLHFCIGSGSLLQRFPEPDQDTVQTTHWSVGHWESVDLPLNILLT